MHTPWGPPHGNGTPYGEGIMSYTTSSHGGFCVAPDLNAKIPDYLRAATFNGQGERGWYEEDHDWCIVALIFPERFTETEAAEAHKFAAVRFDFPGASNKLADAYARWKAERRE